MCKQRTELGLPESGVEGNVFSGYKASLVAQTVKNPLAVQETWVRSLGWEDVLEEDMATHFSILAWRIPMDRGAWWAMVHGVAKSWTRLSDQAHSHKRSSRALRCDTIPVANNTVCVWKHFLTG